MALVPVAVADGKKLKALRLERGWSANQLAKKIGPHRHERTIYNLESGGKNASLTLISQIARVLGVSEADLIAEDQSASAA